MTLKYCENRECYSFRIILELLALQISPEDIYILLKQICPRSIDKQQTVNTSKDVPNTLPTN